MEPKEIVTVNNDSSSDLDVPEPVTNDNSEDELLEDVENIRQETEYYDPQFEDNIVPISHGSRRI